MAILTQRWTPLRHHPIQRQVWTSPHRFNIISAGRRSGKTELEKRKLVKNAICGTAFDNARFFAAAPIREQAKRIYWTDLKAMVPPWALKRAPSETELTIRLINDSEICVLGMDEPARIEGSPWDGGVLDEYANMKEGAWGAHVRPALADRNGWCDLIGVPEGRNHYYDMDERARREILLRGDKAEFGSYTWTSSTVLPREEIEAARRDLPPKMFQQEYEGQFVDWAGEQFFDADKWLIDGLPVPWPNRCDSIVAVIDTALKDGKAHDATGVTYTAYTGRPPPGMPNKLVILDWDLVQIEGAALEEWLPSVYARMHELAAACGARMGPLPPFIEDTGSGTVLLQQARRRGWSAEPCPESLRALGKDGRAFSVSGYHHRELCKISQHAYDKATFYKENTKNHQMTQVLGFRVGDKDAHKRADELLDTYCYTLAITLGDQDGY